MQTFLTTLITVSIMLLFAVPGFILIKVKAVKAESIPAFSKVLMYVCQPALTLYSFNKADFTPELGINLLIFFAIITVAQLLLIGVFFLIFRKKMENVRYRIATIATTLSNCSFLGVPLLEALFPEWQNAAVYSMIYFLSMNLLGWTLFSAIITRDKKYVSVKKIVFNPATLSILVALPFFFMGFKLDGTNGEFLAQFNSAIYILGKMTTRHAACNPSYQTSVHKPSAISRRGNQSDRISSSHARRAHLATGGDRTEMVYVYHVRLPRGGGRTKLC